MGIVGVGIDVVDTARFAASLKRTPALRDRLFDAAELAVAGDSVPRLAARFAAKEAVAKALGAPAGLAWHDCAVRTADTGRPVLEVTGTVAAAAAAAGVTHWHLSLTHDGGVSAAYVIAEART